MFSLENWDASLEIRANQMIDEAQKHGSPSEDQIKALRSVVHGLTLKNLNMIDKYQVPKEMPKNLSLPRAAGVLSKSVSRDVTSSSSSCCCSTKPRRIRNIQVSTDIVGYVIDEPGNYQLCEDIYYDGPAFGAAIGIASSGVHLDLNGHAIRPLAGNTNKTNGIRVMWEVASTIDHISVKNGKIEGFLSSGFYSFAFSGSSACHWNFSDLYVVGNNVAEDITPAPPVPGLGNIIGDVYVFQVGGFVLETDSASVVYKEIDIDHCSFIKNTIVGLALKQIDGLRIESCNADDNFRPGPFGVGDASAVGANIKFCNNVKIYNSTFCRNYTDRLVVIEADPITQPDEYILELLTQTGQVAGLFMFDVSNTQMKNSKFNDNFSRCNATFRTEGACLFSYNGFKVIQCQFNRNHPIFDPFAGIFGISLAVGGVNIGEDFNTNLGNPLLGGVTRSNVNNRFEGCQFNENADGFFGTFGIVFLASKQMEITNSQASGNSSARGVAVAGINSAVEGQRAIDAAIGSCNNITYKNCQCNGNSGTFEITDPETGALLNGSSVFGFLAIGRPTFQGVQPAIMKNFVVTGCVANQNRGTVAGCGVFIGKSLSDAVVFPLPGRLPDMENAVIEGCTFNDNGFNGDGNIFSIPNSGGIVVYAVSKAVLCSNVCQSNTSGIVLNGDCIPDNGTVGVPGATGEVDPTPIGFTECALVQDNKVVANDFWGIIDGSFGFFHAQGITGSTASLPCSFTPPEETLTNAFCSNVALKNGSSDFQSDTWPWYDYLSDIPFPIFPNSGNYIVNPAIIGGPTGTFEDNKDYLSAS